MYNGSPRTFPLFLLHKAAAEYDAVCQDAPWLPEHDYGDEPAHAHLRDPGKIAEKIVFPIGITTGPSYKAACSFSGVLPSSVK